MTTQLLTDCEQLMNSL